MKIKNVQVIKTENNSNELFKKWNIKNQRNVKCSISECPTSSEDNAYIVIELVNLNKFITPLSIDCYKREISYKNQTRGDFIDYGTFISIKESLLMEEDKI